MCRKQGDVSRRRRLAGPPAKLAWYARYRNIRFARRLWAARPYFLRIQTRQVTGPARSSLRGSPASFRASLIWPWW